MVRFFPMEEWKEVKFGTPLRMRYAISNYGRFISFREILSDGTLLMGGTVKGYKVFRYNNITTAGRVYSGWYFHKMVAEYFVPKEHENQDIVLHLDHNKSNNHFNNLKWASKDEAIEHNRSNPSVVESIERMAERNRNAPGHKLTETQVKRIKKMIFNPNRKTRLKLIARQFNISEMQLYRIKSGENWGHVTDW